MVNLDTRVHNGAMSEDHGWFSYTGSDRSHLAAEQRQVAEARMDQRGQLLGVVQVRVFQNRCEPFVTFPQDAILGVETDQSVIEKMVARARSELANWR
jgi:hypothetical protein